MWKVHKKHLDTRIGAILETIQSDIVKWRARLISSIIRPRHTRTHIVALVKTIQWRGCLELSQEGVWDTHGWGRSHLWLNSLSVWLHSQRKVEQEWGIDTLGQRVVYHCSESNCWCGRGVHVVESIARVGIDRDVHGELVVSNIKPRHGVGPCNYKGWGERGGEEKRRRRCVLRWHLYKCKRNLFSRSKL